MRCLRVLIAFAVQAAVLSAASWGDVPGSVEFSPPTFVPGEVVTVVSMLDPGTSPWQAGLLEAGLPDSGDSGPQVLSVALEARRGSPLLVVRFIAWRAGPGYLPEMSVGGLDIPRIRFDCQSTLMDGNFKAPEPLPQLDLPGLYTRIYVLAGLLLLSALAGIAAITKLTPWFKAYKARRAYARARREFDELLDRLAVAVAEPAAWAELCTGLRNFAGLRAGIDLSAMTAAEVLALPADSVPGNTGGDLAAILAMGDEARFSGRRDMRPGAGVALARSMADRIDEALLAAQAPGRNAP